MKDSFLCFLFAALVLRSSDKVMILCFCFGIVFLIAKQKFFPVVIVMLLVLRCVLFGGLNASDEITGRVVKLYENSFQIETRYGKVQIVSKEKPILDSKVHCIGKLKIEEDSSHFFQTESVSQAWMICEKVEVVQEGRTLRSWIHRRIMSFEDQKIHDFLMKILLHCSNDSDFGIAGSIYLSFLIRFIKKVSCFFYHEKTCTKIEISSIVLFSSLWNLEMTGLRFLYFKACRRLHISFYDSLGMYGIFMILLQPLNLYSSSFWFAVVIRLALKSIQSKRLGLIWILMMMQMCFYGKCDAAHLLLNPLIQLVSMGSLLLSLLALVLPVSLDLWFVFLESFETALPSFELHGTVSFYSILILIYLMSYLNVRKQFVLMAGAIGLCSLNLISKITFINVGQGDAALIQLPFRMMNVLIDTGPASSLTQLKNTLYANSVYEIDLLIVSHQDSDHSANVDALKEAFVVKEIWDNTQKRESYDELNLLQLNEYDENESENDRSLILAFEMNGLAFVFNGDAGSHKEETAVNKLSESVDVCKISHHGSSTSTSLSYLDKAGCTVAIISSGKNNYYGHPHEEVLERLHKNGSTVLNTQIHGDIQIIMTRFFNLVTTSSHEFGIIGKY